MDYRQVNNVAALESKQKHDIACNFIISHIRANRSYTYSATRKECQLTTFSHFWVYLTNCLVYDYNEKSIM